MNLNTLNAKLRKMNIPVRAIKGAGYFYWLDMRPGDHHGLSIDGANTMAYKSSFLTEEQWLADARYAAGLAAEKHLPFNP